jgi:type I restriction enzyme S subunit
MPIPVPPLDEARTIVSLASELSGVSDAEQDLSLMSNDATRLKQSILKAAFEGRLVPQDARDEPASVMLSRLRESETSSPRRRRARASA